MRAIKAGVGRQLVSTLIRDGQLGQELLVGLRQLRLEARRRQRPALARECPLTRRTGAGNGRTGLAIGNVFVGVLHDDNLLKTP